MEAQVAKRRLCEDVQPKGEGAEEVQRREQGAFMRDIRARHAEKKAKVPVQAPQPVQEEDDDMDQYEEDTEAGE